jgi:hypothetical protein
MGFTEVRSTQQRPGQYSGTSVCYVYADSPAEW